MITNGDEGDMLGSGDSKLGWEWERIGQGKFPWHRIGCTLNDEKKSICVE